MGAVMVRAFLFFSAGFIAAYALAFLAFGIWRGNAGAGVPNGSFLENAAIASYVLLVTTVPAAFGFAIVTSPWLVFRNLEQARVAWLALAGGVATYLAQLTGIVAVLFRIPLPAWLGPINAALRLLFPGMAVGLIVLAAVRITRRAAAPETRGP